MTLKREDLDDYNQNFLIKEIKSKIACIPL